MKLSAVARRYGDKALDESDDAPLGAVLRHLRVDVPSSAGV
jgi:hypothetical protein